MLQSISSKTSFTAMQKNVCDMVFKDQNFSQKYRYSTIDKGAHLEMDCGKYSDFGSLA